MLQFGALKLVRSFQSYHALQVLRDMAPGGSDARKPVLAYWLAPLGGYIDNPSIPKANDPKFVFTPSFDRGSLIADILNGTTLRICHVIDTLESVEHNKKVDEHHGFSVTSGTAGRMIYSDYGFHINADSCKYVENGNAFAFIKFDNGIQHWVITFQAILHHPAINEISFAQRNNWKVKTKFSSLTRIVMVDSKILAANVDLKGKTVGNKCYYGHLLA